VARTVGPEPRLVFGTDTDPDTDPIPANPPLFASTPRSPASTALIGRGRNRRRARHARRERRPSTEIPPPSRPPEAGLGLHTLDPTWRAGRRPRYCSVTKRATASMHWPPLNAAAVGPIPAAGLTAPPPDRVAALLNDRGWDPLPPGRFRQRGVASVDYCSAHRPPATAAAASPAKAARLRRAAQPAPCRLAEGRDDATVRHPRRDDSVSIIATLSGRLCRGQHLGTAARANAVLSTITPSRAEPTVLLRSRHALTTAGAFAAPRGNRGPTADARRCRDPDSRLPRNPRVAGLVSMLSGCTTEDGSRCLGVLSQRAAIFGAIWFAISSSCCCSSSSGHR
jgi:hypothetical protein